MYPPERPELIPPHQTLLLSEPIFRNPGEEESKKTIFKVPLGSERYVHDLAQLKLTEEEIAEKLANEYLSLAHALKSHGAAFRLIIAHRNQMDQVAVLAILHQFQVRGLGLHPAISSTCFPRDMMVDFEGKLFINPEANIQLLNDSGIRSPLGEGGMVLKSGKKVFVADPDGFIKTKQQYTKHIRSLSEQFKFGFLPFPVAVEVDTVRGTSTHFSNAHIDRAAASIRGKDEKDYLLVDRLYMESAYAPWGKYRPYIDQACKKLGVTPVVVDKSQDVPYSLNFVQFHDRSVLMTSGHDGVRSIVREIVGEDMVKTTHLSIVYYPFIRQGGIRCLTLFAPQTIVGAPIRSNT